MNGSIETGGSAKSRTQVIGDMVIFVEVGRRKNFTNAAKHLGIPLSTVARRISSLEEELGVTLIERTTRHQRLTPEGHLFFERCQHIVDEAVFAYDEVHDHSHGLSGRIRLGLSLQLVAGFISEAVLDFVDQYKNIQVCVDAVKSDAVPGVTFDLLVRGGMPVEHWLVTSKVGSLDMSLYAAPSYLARYPEISERKHLLEHKMLVSNEARSSCDAAMKELVADNVNLGGRLTCETCLSVASFAAAGAGLALLPVNLAAQLVKAGTLVPVLAGWSPSRLAVHIVTDGRLMPARLRIFASFLTKSLFSEFALASRDKEAPKTNFEKLFETRPYDPRYRQPVTSTG